MEQTEVVTEFMSEGVDGVVTTDPPHAFVVHHHPVRIAFSLRFGGKPRYVAQSSACSVGIDVHVTLRIPGKIVPVGSVVVVPGQTFGPGDARRGISLRIDLGQIELDPGIESSLGDLSEIRPEEIVGVVDRDLDLLVTEHTLILIAEDVHHHRNPVQRAVGIVGGILDRLVERAVAGTHAQVALTIAGIGGA